LKGGWCNKFQKKGKTKIDKMILCRKLDIRDNIDCLYQWFDKCPPQGKLKHWKDGRSAKETAKYWLHTIPSEFKELLKPLNLNYMICSPEFISKFDNYGGNDRNNDLLIISEKKTKEKVVISIESKVDEEFGDTVSKTIIEANKRIHRNPNSKGLLRIEDLRKTLFGCEKDDQLPIRYQLLTAIAGTLAEAKQQGSKTAIFIVQTFVSSEINNKKHFENQNDLNRFLNLISESKFPEIKDGDLLGPVRIPGNNEYISCNIDLFIGKYSIQI
jgi:hypothetical protein